MTRRRTVAATAIGMIVGTFAAWVVMSASAQPQTRPLPDSHVVTVSDRQATAAVEAALRAPRVASALEDERWRAVNHRWETGDRCPAPCVATIFYRYDSNSLVEVWTSRGGDLLDMRIGRGQPPISLDEQVVAHALAERDAQVRATLGGDAHVHGATAYSLYPDSGVCARHRCAGVVFMLDDLARTGTGRQLQVIVDLSTDRVVRRDKQRCAQICEGGW